MPDAGTDIVRSEMGGLGKGNLSCSSWRRIALGWALSSLILSCSASFSFSNAFSSFLRARILGNHFQKPIPTKTKPERYPTTSSKNQLPNDMESHRCWKASFLLLFWDNYSFSPSDQLLTYALMLMETACYTKTGQKLYSQSTKKGRCGKWGMYRISLRIRQYFLENPGPLSGGMKAEDEEGGAISLIIVTLILQWTGIQKEDGHSHSPETFHLCPAPRTWERTIPKGQEGRRDKEEELSSCLRTYVFWIEAWENEKLNSMSKQ